MGIKKFRRDFETSLLAIGQCIVRRTSAFLLRYLDNLISVFCKQISLVLTDGDFGNDIRERMLAYSETIDKEDVSALVWVI